MDLLPTIASGFALIFGELPEQGDRTGLIVPRVAGGDDASRHPGLGANGIPGNPHQHHDVS